MIHIIQNLHSLISVMEFVELNWSCKRMKKVRSNQAAILELNLVNCTSCTELLNFPCEYR